ncbi:hypothetical protein [Nonomuraea salmonea]|uniref:hypothetical protein n=1 Tax=Nonomuraea salmonea TaxID=46181 RepID=UPI002FED9F23
MVEKVRSMVAGGCRGGVAADVREGFLGRSGQGQLGFRGQAVFGAGDVEGAGVVGGALEILGQPA